VRKIILGLAAAALLALAGFAAVSAIVPDSSVAQATTTTDTGTSTTGTTTTEAPATEEADVSTSTSDWVLIALEGLVVIGFIALGVRTGGIGLGLWGGVGTLVLVFGFQLDPGEPPISAILIIVAVISAAAAMEAAGGIDYMVLIASKALRARPRAINFAAPYVSYLLCILTGTSNTFFSIIPVINEVAYANKIRPERPLAGSTVASAFGITSSPVAAAMATILPLVEVYDYNLVDVLLITIPASIVGIFVMSFVMSRHGVDLEQDAEYRRRVDAGLVQPPAAASDIQLMPYAKRSVAIFLGAVLVICIFGLFEDLRPTIAAEDGGVEPLSVTPIIQMVMLTAAALIVVFSKVKAADIPSMPIFRSGMVAMIALFGIAWMADTFIASNEDAIVEALGGLAEQWPFMIAVSIFMVAALTTSQSAATRTMVPLGLALGIGAGYMIAMWTAVVGVLFLPANGTQIAAAEADTTGTTTLGKRVVDHSFQLPLQVGWIVTALVGIGIVAVFH
jgi:anaerobic C4-dicarboxylate transporter-like protein